MTGLELGPGYCILNDSYCIIGWRSTMKAEDLRLEELVTFSEGLVCLHGRRLILHAVHAMAQFRKAAGICPDNPQIPITAATAALRHNRPELAIELLRGAERRFSGSARLYRVLGLSYYRLGDYRSSQVALRQALSLDKSSALAYLLMGCTLSKLGQFESAEAHLQKAQTIDPRYTVRR